MAILQRSIYRANTLKHIKHSHMLTCYSSSLFCTTATSPSSSSSTATSSSTTSSSSTNSGQTSELPIIITDASVNRLNFLKQKRSDNDLMLRIAVSAGGCSGFQYEFEFANTSDIEEEEDVILSKNDAKFVVDKTSLKFIKGAKLDFVQDFIQTSFVLIDNPNIVSECGCNVSFTPNPEILEQD